MGDQYLGEIRMVGFSFAPAGWLPCDGRLLPITQYQALFALLSTTFGGDGVTTFGLPDLRGRAPVGMGSGPGLTPVTQGDLEGSESVIISEQQMPVHTHVLSVAGTETASTGAPTATNNVLGASGTGQGSATIWSTALNSPIPLNLSQVGTAGGNQALPIRAPYIGTNFIIAFEGIFPTRG